jgi:hypothetical protein
MKTRAHLAIVQSVGDGDDGHALVMGHEIAHDGNVFVIGKPRAREIERLVKTVAAERAQRGETGVIALRAVRVHHRRERRRVRRDHHIFGEAAFQAEAGNTEIGILISELHVAGVVGRFGNAPRNTQRAPVSLLALHHQAAGLFQQAADRRAHHQRWHQVFEHRTGPGNQRRAAAQRRRGAAEANPVAGRDIALGDGEQAGEPRFRSEQVVATGVEAVVGEGITDRQ